VSKEKTRRTNRLSKNQAKKIKRKERLKIRISRKGYTFSKDTVAAMIDIASIKSGRGL